jgi:hypothetical protein
MGNREGLSEIGHLLRQALERGDQQLRVFAALDLSRFVALDLSRFALDLSRLAPFLSRLEVSPEVLQRRLGL